MLAVGTVMLGGTLEDGVDEKVTSFAALVVNNSLSLLSELKAK